jgi:hypothetical protein
MRVTTDRSATAAPVLDAFEFVPLIEELDVPAASVGRGLNRRAVLLIAVAGAIVGYGFITTGDGPRSADGAVDELAVAATPAVVASPDAAAPENRAAPLAVSPLVGSSTWSVAGAAEPSATRVTIEARIGSLVLGHVDADTVGGRFRARLPILLRGPDPVPIDIVVEDSASGRELSRRTIRAHALPMAAEGAVTHLPSGDAQVHLAGTADLSIGALGVTISRAGGSRTVRVPVAVVADERNRAGAQVLGLGRWFATVTLSPGDGPFAIEIRAQGRADDQAISLLLPAGGGPLTSAP